MRRKIFISYRRADSGAHVQGIAQYLANVFGRKQVVLDVDTISGADFPRTLKKWLSECKVLLVLIGPGWLNARDDKGRRRLDDPSDWVRLEIQEALGRGIAMIPVLIAEAKLPIREQLPGEIARLLEYQAAFVRNETFPNDLAGLAKNIAKHLGSPWLSIAAAGAAALLLVAGITSYSAWTGRMWWSPVELNPPGAGLTRPESPPLTTDEVLARCARDQRHPDAADIVANLVHRFKEGRFRYGWVVESTETVRSGFVWHDIIEAEANESVLLLRIAFRNGRLRLIPIVQRQFSTRSARLSLLLEGMWSQDNGYGCVEMFFDNENQARGAIGVMTAKRLDTEARIERVIPSH
jgi:TIR domain